MWLGVEIHHVIIRYVLMPRPINLYYCIIDPFCVAITFRLLAVGVGGVLNMCVPQLIITTIFSHQPASNARHGQHQTHYSPACLDFLFGALKKHLITLVVVRKPREKIKLHYLFFLCNNSNNYAFPAGALLFNNNN